jgi:Flp pilus assembly secretin CpaC
MRARSWIKHWAIAVAAMSAALFSAFPTTAFADDIRIAVDQATPLRLAGSAEGVAVGNPSIAGVTIQEDRLLFITGRAFGSTNLVVVGSNGRLLYSGRIVVTSDEGPGVVTVTRGTDTSRMSCNPICRPSPEVGDGAQSFGEAHGQMSAHNSSATSN